MVVADDGCTLMASCAESVALLVTDTCEPRLARDERPRSAACPAASWVRVVFLLDEISRHAEKKNFLTSKAKLKKKGFA